MQFQSVLFLAFAALGFAYDKDIDHKGVTYHVAGVPDEGVQCSRGTFFSIGACVDHL